MQITLAAGTMDSNANLDGWIITSKTAVAEGHEDMLLVANDQIRINGDVHREGRLVGSVA